MADILEALDEALIAVYRVRLSKQLDTTNQTKVQKAQKLLEEVREAVSKST